MEGLEHMLQTIPMGELFQICSMSLINIHVCSLFWRRCQILKIIISSSINGVPGSTCVYNSAQEFRVCFPQNEERFRYDGFHLLTHKKPDAWSPIWCCTCGWRAKCVMCRRQTQAYMKQSSPGKKSRLRQVELILLVHVEACGRF